MTRTRDTGLELTQATGHDHGIDKAMADTDTQTGEYDELKAQLAYEGNKVYGVPHVNQLLCGAADAIEALQRRVGELEANLDAVSEAHRGANEVMHARKRECEFLTKERDEARATAELGLKTLRESANFVRWREKMHPTGVELYDEAVAKIEATLSPHEQQGESLRDRLADRQRPLTQEELDDIGTPHLSEIDHEQGDAE